MFTTKKLLILVLKNSLISLVFLGVTIVAIVFIKNEIESVTDSVVLNHRLKAQLREKTELLSVLERDSKIIGENDILIKKAFISSENISGFIDDLDKTASESSITQIYRFETPTASNISGPFPLSSIPYSNNITTGLLSFSNYLKNFEKLPYFTKIESFNISSQDKVSGWLGQSTISLKAILITKTIQ